MIKIGIIGIGVMGSHHLRIVSAMPNVKEVIISDNNSDKLTIIKQKYNVAAYTNHIEMLKKEELDAVIIAVPTEHHKRIAKDCLNYNAHILVEKPIAETPEDAEEMIKLAEEKNKILTVGHVERFNPVVTKLKKLIDDKYIGETYLVKTIRVGPFPKRLYGCPGGVLVDLAVHDIDVIQYLVGPVKKVYAQLMTEGAQEIYSKVLLNVHNNVKASCEFSWVSPKRVREIEIYGTKGMFKCAYDNQTIFFYENADFTEDKKNIFTGGHISSGKIIELPVEKDEPLRAELENFVNSVLKKDKPLVRPREAQQALKVALAILSSGKENKVIGL